MRLTELFVWLRSGNNLFTEINKEETVIKFENANSRWIKSTGKDDVQDLNLDVSRLC